ncbi:MAG: putative phage Mu protein -like protein [Herbinix sp.]|jgi:uncharacterized phage protein gp47/JayE|nr:putative phage Mu protein -like protein [Herbinix sp.]
MYENLTVEAIKNNILGRITTDIDLREGSFTNDMISAVAYEIWKNYQSLDAILPIIYVDSTSGEYIDKRCTEYGITRKSGTKATAILTITGTNGTVIPKGKVFLTAEGFEFILDNDISITGGTANGTVTAEEIGDKYNVAPGMITRQFVNQSGISTVSNAIATGGTDQESDAALVTRLYNFIQKPATSGNANQYRQWAMEVPGVGDAIVFPLWDGPGTVKIVIVDANKQPASSTIVNNTLDYIENVRPIGATIAVESGVGKDIDITAVAMLAPGYNLETISTNFINSVNQYFKSIAFTTSYVSHAKIGTLLLGTEGIIDYSDLHLNGSSANVLLLDNEIPLLDNLSLEV